ncbi:SGNH hydrolase-type esterase domain-containing protein [Xylaria bambusicola]|uniref:SGNH hydrolase-type esterase domain-containing protein n=1 Tax=Xylaria bambusicola TaxID=326684 RepID=UPI0020077858|nr:SGNH hydrolase-type esterase domain-containing protein [Xylaria bambusicola]KAI0521494.1 SGNH hydrolase-type esterase domain-containing protein [Xylaria bambusicola]
MSSILDKPVPVKGKSRFAFLKTKRAIVVLTLLVVVSVVLIALGATHEFTPHHDEQSVSNPDSLGDNLGTSDGSSNAGNGTNSGDSGDSSSNNGGGIESGHNSTSSDGNHNGSNDNNDNNTSSNNTNNTADGKNDDDDKDEDSPTKNPSLWHPKNSSSIADGTPLRIMCLGASIVRGELSSDSNGFRNTLRGDLATLGAPINMVGSQRNGVMPDNDFEAYGGNRVKQIHDHAKAIVPKQKPNIFIINVGTNNVLQRRDVDVAGKHMEAFIDYLLSASPRSTVVLSTLLTNTVPNREPLILDINQQLRTLYSKYENNTAVVLAELHPSEGLAGRPQVEDISGDGSHPTDRGYEIMGHILADAVKEADEKGYLRWPEDGLAYDGEKGRLDSTAD